MGVVQIFFDPSPIGVDYAEIVEAMSALPDPIAVGGSRLVVHIQTSQQAVEDLLAVIRKLAEEKKAAGFVPSEQQVNGQVNGNVYVKVKRPTA